MFVSALNVVQLECSNWFALRPKERFSRCYKPSHKNYSTKLSIISKAINHPSSHVRWCAIRGVLEVNAEYSSAVVEPGVTFTDLYDHCVKSKFNVWPSCPSLGWGSVVGNTVDRGAGFTPTAMHHQHIFPHPGSSQVFGLQRSHEILYTCD